jgi:F420-0:gamma-glutamyl ligase
MAGCALGGLVELCLGSLGFFCLEERAGCDGARATLELAQQADAVVKELKGFSKLVRGDLGEPVIGDEEGVLWETMGVSEQDAQLVEHLHCPENEGLVGSVALLEVGHNGSLREVEGKCVGHNEHGRSVNVL